MTKQLALALISVLVVGHAEAAKAPRSPPEATEENKIQYKVVTASERGTYIVLGRDLATWIAPDAGIELEAVPSAGSSENVFRLRYEAGVKLALVQSDVYQAFLDQAAAGNKDAGKIIRPLRVIIPLYNEEIYFVVRADSPLNYVHEIKDARINAGPYGSGTALTALTLYQSMYRTALPKGTTTFLTNEEGLVKLTGDKTVDVVVITGGQPMKLLADMKPEAKDLIKLLKFDATNPASKDALKTYFPAAIYARSYPNLLKEDLPGIAVKAFLVTYDYNLQQTVGYLARFAKSLCQNFSLLQEKGHPKWKDVQLSLPELGEGWSYYPPTAKQIRACDVHSPIGVSTSRQPQFRGACSPVETVLGLCEHQ
jgi:TRAP transporter TAXI family solute receptor